MYIETVGDSDAMHVFQINPGSKGSGQEWAEVLWNNISNTGAPNYGNLGRLIYKKSFKMPFVQSYVNNDTATFGKTVSFDPATKQPAFISLGGFGNDHGSGGTRVIPWNPNWT